MFFFLIFVSVRVCVQALSIVCVYVGFGFCLCMLCGCVCVLNFSAVKFGKGLLKRIRIGRIPLAATVPRIYVRVYTY